MIISGNGQNIDVVSLKLPPFFNTNIAVSVADDLDKPVRHICLEFEIESFALCRYNLACIADILT